MIKGLTETECITIDSMLKDAAPTFIKMDIEGAEIQALKGAREHIINDNPAMAICVYHRVDDLWKIPAYIRDVNPNYRFYLRHYSYYNTETVLYCIPK